ERDVLAHGDRKHGVLALRHDSDSASHFGTLDAARVRIADADRSPLDRDSPDERAHERALATAVRANNRGHASWRGFQADAIERGVRLPRVANYHVGERDHDILRSITRK